MRTRNEIYADINKRFYDMTKYNIETGSMMDFLVLAVAESYQDAYVEIEAAKNPYMWSKLSGAYLDDTGNMLGCAREAGETDDKYRYRILNWVLRAETGNAVAMQAALLNLTYASSAVLIPKALGSGTALVYVIPKIYDTETMANALREAQEKAEIAAPAGLYMEYVIPAPRAVKPLVSILAPGVDMITAKANISSKVRLYINAIEPGQYIEASKIAAFGMAEPGVTYCGILTFYINGVEIQQVQILQELSAKFMLDAIIWVEG